MSNIRRLTAYKWVPPFAQGLVRDIRVRWALEEAGLSYDEKLLDFGAQNTPEHRAVQPFGQVPVYQEDNLTLFESGSIVMHIGESAPILLPVEPGARARVRTWIIAALNSVEPHVQALVIIDLFHAQEEWAILRRPGALAMAQARLGAVAATLADREYLENQFSGADVLMTTVLRLLRHTTVVSDIPALAAYQARCEARPAFKRALAAQLAAFERYAPAAAPAAA
ncbi:MAG: glutathione S-transferase family protein [Steroidobacteraceae bacterium]|jgi:glutathione S-transferase